MILSHAARRRPARAGITLTEILISILIMGVGMLSLATLFPLGIQRLREAARSSRSSMLIESATSEMGSRDLLYKPSFSVNGYPYDPFTEDPFSPGDDTTVVPPHITKGLDRIPSYSDYPSPLVGGTGLPVCYDPLWWYQVNISSDGAIQPSLTPGSDFRFGSGLGLLRNDPGGGSPSAHGLQRITNFPLIFFPTPPQGQTRNFPIDPAPAFCSPDDLVMQTDGTPDLAQGRGSPLVPDLSTNARMYDYSYTWMFTGKQTDVTNGTIFDGDLVIFHNRPFAIEQRTGPTGTSTFAAGETVVEAIWGYSSTLATDPVTNVTVPYGRSDRSVLLRWHMSQPDPDVRAGGWIADVTYERFNALELSRFYPNNAPGTYPAQRCYWYRVAKKADPTVDGEDGNYRSMVVTLASPVHAKTQITAGGSAVHVNAALISPYVVNVVPRVFYTR